jgi:glycosyltransferase involved in cell wall biosynthesis
MTTLIICTAPGLGGLELYAEREYEFLNQYRLSSAHFALSEGSRLNERFDGSSKNNLLRIKSGKLLPLRAARIMARYIDQHQIDVIHMHWSNDLHLCALAKLFSNRKPKLIYTRHMRISRPKKDIVHRFFYRQVDLILAVSQCVRDEARRFLPLDANQIQLFHSGVPAPETVLESCQSKLPGYSSKPRFNIGMFGRIEHYKGQHLLIDAVIALSEQGMDVSATIIGHAMDEDYLARLKQTVRNTGLEERVQFLGFIDKPTQLMPCFDVIVLLTYCETFGLTLVEAMRAGVCVIGTDAGGVPDIIDHEQTGLLIEPGNSEMLVEACKRLQQDETFKRQLAQQGKEKADQLFDESTHFKQLIDKHLTI